MAKATSQNTHDDPARTEHDTPERHDTPEPSDDRSETVRELDEVFRRIKPPQVPINFRAPEENEDLTSGAGECQNPVEMPAKEARPGRKDPALQEAFDAFDGAKLPRPPLAKLTGLTPAEGLNTLRTLVEYLDSISDPVAKVVNLLLSELHGQSFDSLVGTKEWATLVQWILDRTGYVVECPKCSEPARLDTAPHRSAASGSIRYRHTGATHGGSGALPDPSLRRIDRPE